MSEDITRAQVEDALAWLAEGATEALADPAPSRWYLVPRAAPLSVVIETCNRMIGEMVARDHDALMIPRQDMATDAALRGCLGRWETRESPRWYLVSNLSGSSPVENAHVQLEFAERAPADEIGTLLSAEVLTRADLLAREDLAQLLVPWEAHDDHLFAAGQRTWALRMRSLLAEAHAKLEWGMVLPSNAGRP
jgi:hypothetical protein